MVYILGVEIAHCSYLICVLCLCVVCVEAATLKLKVYIARKYSIAGDDTPLRELSDNYNMVAPIVRLFKQLGELSNLSEQLA